MPKIGVVRYGAMERTERFPLPEDEDINVGSAVVLRTRRGVEWGRLLMRAEEERERSGDSGEVLRRATAKDREKQEAIEEQAEPEEARRCKRLIEKHDLPMKLVRVEHLFGGNKIIFYFMADGRVDFRGLVRDLAKEYRTRIEMRQIGVRDEARIMGLVGPCGNELCCRRFLTELKPVPMKLAKHQKSTLDPAKISGCCGRLKCCLKYEEELYKELKRELPRRGVQVQTPVGQGTVVGYQVIAQTVTVEMEDGSKQKFPAGKVEESGGG
ncbi:MAG: PSP1 domain-containing protein [Planctomycetota bacterium]